jgi:hypothetical protein
MQSVLYHFISETKIDDTHSFTLGKTDPIHLFCSTSPRDSFPLLLAHGNQQLSTPRSVLGDARAFHDSDCRNGFLFRLGVL